MGCGHTSNATKDGKPICLICYGIHNGATVPIKEYNDTEGLEGRKAKCNMCDNKTDSNWRLFLFEHRPHCEYDSYYCGCRGWN